MLRAVLLCCMAFTKPSYQPPNADNHLGRSAPEFVNDENKGDGQVSSGASGWWDVVNDALSHLQASHSKRVKI